MFALRMSSGARQRYKAPDVRRQSRKPPEGIWSLITAVGVVFTGKREWCVVKEGILTVSILHVLRRHPVETEVPSAGVICRRDPSAMMTGAVIGWL
jgi:hypothetical protein